MAWETSDRKDRLPSNWEALRQETLKTDGHRCVWPGRWAAKRGVKQCGEPATDVDHVRRGDDHSPSNLQSLCKWHHTQKTQSESAAARRAAIAKTRHPAPYAKHPGLK